MEKPIRMGLTSPVWWRVPHPTTNAKHAAKTIAPNALQIDFTNSPPARKDIVRWNSANFVIVYVNGGGRVPREIQIATQTFRGGVP
jgi:hypothetical protein